MKCDYCCQPIEGLHINRHYLNYHVHCLAHFETFLIRHNERLKNWRCSNKQSDGLAGNHTQD